MQGQRSTVHFFPETLDYEHPSRSNGADPDHQQGFWSSAVNPGDAHSVPGYVRGRPEVSLPYRHAGGDQDEGFRGWSLRGSSSSSSDPRINLNGYGDSEAAGSGWMASSAGYPAAYPRFGERRLEARGHPFPHNSSSTDASAGIIGGGGLIPQPAAGPPLYHPFASEDDQRASTSGSSSSCGIFVRDGVSYLSDDAGGFILGGFLDGRRQSAKRKNLEGPSGQSSGSSSGGPFHQADGRLLHSAPERNLPSGSLNISGARGAGSEHPSLIGPGGNSDGLRSNFHTRVNAAHQLDGSSSHMWPPGNPNLHHRACPPHHTSPSPNSFVQPLEVRQAMPSASSHQPPMPTIPALPPMVYLPPWSGISSSRVGSSADVHMGSNASPGGGPREEANPRGLERSNLPEHPLFAPTADVRRVAQDPGSWSLGNGSMIVPGNAGPFSFFSPSSGVLPPAAPSWMPHQGPTSHGSSSAAASRPGGGLRTPQQQLRSAFLMGRRSTVMGAPFTLRTRQARNMMIFEQIRNALDLMQREESMMIDDVMILDESAFHDRHQDMRLDIDNMSYEELLALEERIGNVSTGLGEDTVQKNLKQRKHLSSAACKAESCCICQEDYADGEDLGVLTCGHDFHASCVGKWLVQKNVCPICKKTALPT